MDEDEDKLVRGVSMQMGTKSEMAHKREQERQKRLKENKKKPRTPKKQGKGLLEMGKSNRWAESAGMDHAP